MGQLTISMAIFNSYVTKYQRMKAEFGICNGISLDALKLVK